MLVVFRLSSEQQPELVSEALRESAGMIRAAYGLDSDLELSGPLKVEGGEVILVARGWGSSAKLPGREPAMIQEAAERVGLAEGLIEVARPMSVAWAETSFNGEALWPTARGYLYGVAQQPFGPAPRGAPTELIHASLAWLKARSEPDSPVFVLINGAPIPTDWAAAKDLVVALSPQAHVLEVVGDDPRRPIYSRHTPPTVVVTANLHPKVAWIEAAEDDAGLVSAMDAMREHARMTDGVEWAGIMSRATTPNWPIDFTEQDVRHDIPTGGGHVASKLPDISVPDAMWWQMIGPGHIDRLGGRPVGAVQLGDGRQLELTFGGPEQWIPGPGFDPSVRENARRVLAPLLLDDAEADRIILERSRQARENDTTGYFKKPRG